MIRGLALASMLGVAGCSVIIGDIEIPGEEGQAPSAALAGLAGMWRVYGLTASGAFDERVELDAAGGLGAPGAIEPGRVAVGPSGDFEVMFGGAVGRVAGPIDAAGGVGLLVGDGLVWAVMVREPASPQPLPTGWGVVTGLTEDGDASGGVSRLAAGEDEGYTETRYLPAGAVSRVVYVDSDPNDPARRALVPADGMGGDRYLTALGGWAVGVREVGGRLDLALVFEASAEPLPAVDVRCVGVALGDGTPQTRVRSARLGSSVQWSDGGGGALVAVDGGWALPAGQGFFDEVDTLLVGAPDGRLFAALPIRPPTDRQAAEVSWGLALCLVDEASGADEATDAGVLQLGG